MSLYILGIVLVGVLSILFIVVGARRPGRKTAAVIAESEQRPPPSDRGSTLLRGNWSDYEIFLESQDHFGTRDYAKVLASRVATTDTPLTIGIFGQWGIGKTSLMKLTEATLSKEPRSEGPIHSVWLNVWQLTSQDEVWHAFLQALFSKVHRELSLWQRIDKGKLARQLLSNSYRVVLVITPLLLGVLIAQPEADWGDALKLFTQPVAGVGAVMTVGLGLWALVKPAIEAARETVKFDLAATLKYGPYEAQVTALMELQERFAEMVELLVGSDGRLVVFIDDLDRCTPDKVPAVLEAIKLFTTIKGCVYVLGLDYDIVRQGIALKYKFKTPIEAENYLEKMVQIPFHLPPLEAGKIKEFVRIHYPHVCQSFPSAHEIFAEGLEPNPRKVKRVLNIYRTLFELGQERWRYWEMDHRIEPELLAKMVVIQNRFRHLYNHLVENPESLIELEKVAQEGKLLDHEHSDEVKMELENPALGAMLQTGPKYFNQLDPRDLSSYIYLTGTAEGSGTSGTEVRANRREREALLGGDRTAISAQVTEIKEREQAPAYVERLEMVLRDFDRYTIPERISANMALDVLEGWERQEFEPETVLIPAGSFSMGSDPAKDKEAREEEQLQHRVKLPGYRIGRYPVTNLEYQAFVEASGQRPPEHWESGQMPEGLSDHPVVNVSWEDAVAYCRWLSEQSGRSYRLPSEAEWEKAARGDNGRIYPWGDDWDASRANTAESGSGNTTPVGQYSTVGGDSPYGVADMAGNMWEWTADWYQAYPESDYHPNNYGEKYRVVRGGSFLNVEDFVRCA